MKLYKALEDIFNKYGKDMLCKEVLVNFLADYHAYEVKPTRNVLKTLLQLGYGEKIYDLDYKNSLDKLLKIKRYASELVLSQGFQEIHVEYVINSICYALKWLQAPPEDITQEKISESSNYRNIIIGDMSFKMLYVKGASFDMGGTPEQGIFASFDEKPAVQVQLSDFFIGETCVSQKLWSFVMGINPSNFQGDDLPVERVSWHDCKEFIYKLNSLTQCNFRLPTEAEWEYAARGGSMNQHKKYSGTDDFNLADYAWTKENSGGSTHSLMQKKANELGLYDMTGNVSEWCEDWYFNSYANGDTKINPKGPSFGTNKVYRGGSWDDKKINCRVTKRFNMNPIYKNKLVGLRLAATIL